MKEQLLSTLEISRNYTMAVAEAMPGKLYKSRPVKGVWTFGELLYHIAYGIQWWESNYVLGKESPWNPPQPGEDKKLVTDYLRSAYLSLENTINRQELNDTVVKGFYATLDHITHHRGQAVLYLRSQEIAPPDYTY